MFNNKKDCTYTFSGTVNSVANDMRRLGYECNKWEIKVDNTYENEYGVECRCVVLTVTEWKSPEELEELEMYGDYMNDDYYGSDSYRADVEAEKWSWLKNE